MQRVYVVDDDESLRKALSFVLKGLDCDPVPYPSAEHFLTYVPHNEPGIVLLDVRMGQMSGLELQQRLIDTGIDWPVIFLSGHGDLEMAVETMMKGAVCFCKNPYVEKNSRKLWIAQQLCPKLKPTSGKPLSTHFHLEKTVGQTGLSRHCHASRCRAPRNRATHRRISQGKRHAQTWCAHRNRIGRGSQRSKSLTKIAVKR